MKRLLPLVIWLPGCCLFLSSCQTITDEHQMPVVRQGVLDLHSWNIKQDGVIALNGLWEFYWQQLLEPKDFTKPLPAGSKTFTRFPGPWNKHTIDNEPLEGSGYATYRLNIKQTPSKTRYALKILNMSSAYRLWVNGELIAENGVVADNKESMSPLYMPLIAAFNVHTPNTELVLQVSNFQHRKGGAWNEIQLGTEEQIRKNQRYRDFLDLFLLGILMIMSVYHFGLYALRRKDPSALYFGIFCLIIGIRSLFYREMIIYLFIPELSFELISGIRYILTFITIPVFSLFIYSLYPDESSRKIFLSFSLLILILSMVVLLTPLVIYSHTMMIHQTITVAFGLYVSSILFRASLNKRKGALWFLIGFFAFFLVILNDILADHALIQSSFMMPLGLSLFILSQAFVLSLLSSRAFQRVENLIHAYGRFVPENFLAHLRKDDILNVRLGDHALHNMTILFSDIRAFTTISEMMTPQENFNFLNAYLERMEPIITQNNGFIDKYIGDEIMALFAKTPDDAISAGITMLLALEQYNQHRSNSGYNPIKVGIGINTGDLMLGIIGGKNRMDGTVISDAVNLASRMQVLTKTYQTPLLISQHTFKQLSKPELHFIRLIDHVVIQGKTESVAIYEVYDNDAPHVRGGKYNNQSLFNQALDLFARQQMDHALTLFETYLAEAPEDKVAHIYIHRIKNLKPLL